MAGPQVIIENAAYTINLTLLMSVVTLGLMAMGTLIKIFGPSESKPAPTPVVEPKNEVKTSFEPGEHPNCKQHAKDLERIEKSNLDGLKKEEEITKITNQIEKEIILLKKESETTAKTLDEMRNINKGIVQRLDDLLKQLSDYVNS